MVSRFFMGDFYCVVPQLGVALSETSAKCQLNVSRANRGLLRKRDSVFVSVNFYTLFLNIYTNIWRKSSNFVPLFR